MHGSTLAKFRVLLQYPGDDGSGAMRRDLPAIDVANCISSGVCRSWRPIGISLESRPNSRPNPGPYYRSAQEIYLGGLRVASRPLDGSVGSANRRPGLDSSQGRHNVRDFSGHRK